MSRCISLERTGTPADRKVAGFMDTERQLLTLRLVTQLR
jgi:hypothetical protein